MNQATVKPKKNKENQTARCLARLYETDETAWLEQMSQLIGQRQFEILDYKNLQEYLLDMAKRDKREVDSRLRVLIAHVLKWDYQPRKRSRSWDSTIFTQKNELLGLLDSKTLKNHAEDNLNKIYQIARKQAAKETGLKIGAFPEECLYSLEELLTSD